MIKIYTRDVVSVYSNDTITSEIINKALEDKNINEEDVINIKTEAVYHHVTDYGKASYYNTYIEIYYRCKEGV